MARPIKETPTLYGEDARRFAYAVEHPKADCGSRTPHALPLAKPELLRDNMYFSKRMRCIGAYQMSSNSSSTSNSFSLKGETKFSNFGE